MADSYVANKGWDRPSLTEPSDGYGASETAELPLEQYQVESLVEMYQDLTNEILRQVDRRNKISTAINQKMDGIGTTFSNINGHYDERMMLTAKELYRG